jgi:CheY-like chemotaxis protein
MRPTSGRRALLATTQYDAIVLDLRLPDTHGLVWLNEFRESGDSTPVLILTAQVALDDRLTNAKLGASSARLRRWLAQRRFPSLPLHFPGGGGVFQQSGQSRRRWSQAHQLSVLYSNAMQPAGLLH